jgi:hypothetical protein
LYVPRSKHLLSVGAEGFFGYSSTDEYLEANPGSWVLATGADFLRNHAGENVDVATHHVYTDFWWSQLSPFYKVLDVLKTWNTAHEMVRRWLHPITSSAIVSLNHRSCFRDSYFCFGQ